MQSTNRVKRSQIKFEPNVAFPRGGSSTYPWDELKPKGFPFFVRDGKLESVRAAAYGASVSRNTKYLVRSAEGGVRVWRVK